MLCSSIPFLENFYIFLPRPLCELQETVAAGTPQATHGWWHAWPNGLQPQVFPWAKHHSWRLCCVSWNKIQQCHDAMQCVFFPHKPAQKKTCFRTWFRKQGKSHLWRSNLLVSALFVYLRSKASAIYVQLSERRAGMTLTIFVTCGAPQLFFVGLQAHLTKHRSRNYHHWKNNRLPKAHGNPILVGGDWNMTFMTFIDFPYIGNNHPK